MIPAKDFVHIDCQGMEKACSAWGGRIKTEKVTGHPYAVSTTTFRADRNLIDPKYGEYVRYGGETYQIKSISYTNSLCRVIIGCCRTVLETCPTVEAELYEEINTYGSEASETVRKVADLTALIMLAQGSEEFAQTEINWERRYRVYVKPAWGDLLNWSSWFKYEDKWYRVENLIDMDRMCRVPYADCVQEVPTWA